MLRPYYNPEKHHRKSIRLKGYDYTATGYYFVTICTYHRECIFGEIRNDQMILNTIGEIINCQWQNIPGHFKNLELDRFVIMPNHLHGILILTDYDLVVGAKHSQQAYFSREKDINRNASPLQFPSISLNSQPDIPGRPKGTKPGSLSAIVQNFSSVTTRKINRIRKRSGAKLWQRNFYDRIIRNDRQLFNIRQYIINNPAKWESDTGNPNNWKTAK